MASMEPKDTGESPRLTPTWFGDGQPSPPPLPPEFVPPVEEVAAPPVVSPPPLPPPPPEVEGASEPAAPTPRVTPPPPPPDLCEPIFATIVSLPEEPEAAVLEAAVPEAVSKTAVSRTAVPEPPATAPATPRPPASVPLVADEPGAAVRPATPEAEPEGTRVASTPAEEEEISLAAPLSPELSVEPLAEPSEATIPPVPPVNDEVIPGEEESLLQLYVSFAPAWLSSFIFHMLLMIGLAAFMLTMPSSTPPVTINLNAYEETSELVEEFQDLEVPEEVVDTPEEPVEVVEPEPEEIADSEIPPEDTELLLAHDLDFEPGGEIAELQPLGIGPPKGKGKGRGKNMLSGRGSGMKQKLLRRYGGTPETEAAVLAGLGWLARQQLQAGGWRLDGPYADGSRSRNSNAATAMALLAFQGAGYTHRTGENRHLRKAVKRGWYWLLHQQGRGGNFATKTTSHEHYYTHALCTFALCEYYAMTRDSFYRSRAQAAVDYLVRNQDKAGGWRYRGGGSDLSVSGWVMMALQSARMGYLKVPQETFDRFNAYLDKVSSKQGSRYSYTGGGGSLAMTAEGLLCRQYLGWRQDNRSLINGAEYLLDNPINYEGHKNLYYWYYATQVLHHMEGKMWREWNRKLSTEVPAHQVKEGKEQGSWSPQGTAYGGQGGRLYVTCLSIYMLEVYYRHLPIYSKDIRPLERNRKDRQEAAEAAEAEAEANEAEPDKGVPLEEVLDAERVAAIE